MILFATCLSEKLTTLPQDMRLLGKTQHGVYDKVDGVDPVILERYYGAEVPRDSEKPFDLDPNTDEEPDPDDMTDPGSSLDLEVDLELDDSQLCVDLDSEDSFDPESRLDTGPCFDAELSDDSNEDNVDVAISDTEEGSWSHIAEIIAKAQGRNIRHDAAEVASSQSPFESEDEGEAFAAAFGKALESDSYPDGFNLGGEYEPSESYRTGRSSRPLLIPLPHDVWFPRILVWCKALDTLKHIEVARDMFSDYTV